MRTLFLMLVLANLAFFVVTEFGPGADAHVDAHLIGQQLNPEKIRLLAPDQAAVLTRPAPKPAAVCLEWGAFSGNDATRVEQALGPLALGTKLTQRKLEESAGFWVYVPPLPNRQIATQRANELKRLGVDEYFIVPDDPKFRFAISLGIFKTEEAAKGRLEALRAKGVKSATVGARETQLSKTYFQVREANETLATKLNELKQGFPGSEIKECQAEEKKPS
jgi:SPOR domain